jgi:hypothetical protein
MNPQITQIPQIISDGKQTVSKLKRKFHLNQSEYIRTMFALTESV